MKIHPIQLHALPTEDFDSATNWRVMAMTDLDAELKTLESALGGATRKKPDDVPIDNEQWEAWFIGLVPHLPDCAADTVHVLDQASSIHREAFHVRVSQARRALKYAASAVPEGASSTTTVLLPKTWPQRLDMLLGMGELPIAWLMRLDVCQF